MMIIEREKEIGKRKQAIIQTEEIFRAQSSNAESERQREFGIIIILKVRTVWFFTICHYGVKTT